MTKTVRTREQIADAVYKASFGDFIDTDREVAEAQSNLISALTWRECAPIGGWHEKARVQIDALKELAKNPAPPAADDFDGVIAATMTYSEEIEAHIENINKFLYNKHPWNYEFIDNLINKQGA